MSYKKVLCCKFNKNDDIYNTNLGYLDQCFECIIKEKCRNLVFEYYLKNGYSKKELKEMGFEYNEKNNTK